MGISRCQITAGMWLRYHRDQLSVAGAALLVSSSGSLDEHQQGELPRGDPKAPSHAFAGSRSERRTATS